MLVLLWLHLAISALALPSASLFSPDELAAVLSGHTGPRADLGLTALVWDDTVAKVAQDYANKCTWAHNADRTTQYQAIGGSGSVGENIYASTGYVKTTTQATTSWVSEKSDFSCPTNTCASGKVCGHYTQVIWNGTTKVGCGRTQCDINSPFSGFSTWTFVVCDYTAAGNYVGKFPVDPNCCGGACKLVTPSPVTNPTPTPTPSPSPVVVPSPTPTPKPTPTPSPSPVVVPSPTPTPTPSSGFPGKCYQDLSQTKLASWRYWTGKYPSFYSPASCKSLCLSKSSSFIYSGLEIGQYNFCICYASLPTTAVQVDASVCWTPAANMYHGSSTAVAFYV